MRQLKLDQVSYEFACFSRAAAGGVGWRSHELEAFVMRCLHRHINYCCKKLYQNVLYFELYQQLLWELALFFCRLRLQNILFLTKP